MDCIGNFSKLLKELRDSRGLKQSDLAEKLGVSRGSISFYENGDRVPDIIFLYKVAEFFGVSCDYLLGFVDDSVFDADDRAISEATGLSGLSVAILTQSKSSSKLSKILSILIEEEFSFAYVYGDALKKYPNVLSKNMGGILDGIEKEIEDFMGDDDQDTKDFVREHMEHEKIIEFASTHYKPILSHLYDYLICWKNAWTDYDGKRLYITKNGEITESRELGARMRFHQDEMIEYALLGRIQDNIRALKRRRTMENSEKSK